MARQIGLEITGTFDNIIFYEREGEYFIRTVPKQTAATQKAAKNYGRASAKAKTLRQLLQPLLPNPKDRNMQNRLTPAMREFLALLSARKTIQPQQNPLAGFRFVNGSDLKNCLLFPWSVSLNTDGNLALALPAINPIHSVCAPPGTSLVKLQVMAVAFSINGEWSFAGSSETISLPYEDEIQPPVNLIQQLQSEAGGLVVVAAGLSYWNQSMRISQAGFMPVEIVSVFRT